MTLRFLSVCSGIEAASVAWKPLGWTCAVAVDWDHRHAPQSNITPLFGDFTQIESHHVGPIDLLVGGTPCQSFSIAGLRGGLDDDRGNLALEFLRLADRTRPRWLVWENVPGVLSSNKGRDFGAILGGMVELGYGFAYRVLDAQFFGVPQRRRRVFVVGHLGSWQRAAAVLFERQSLSGHPAPRREKGKAVTSGIAGSLGAGDGNRGWRNDLDQGAFIPVPDWPAEVAPTLNAAFGEKLGLEDQHIRGGGDCLSVPQVAMCLNAGAMGRRDAETETLIPTIGAVFDDALETTHTLRGEGFDASEDGTGRGTPLVPVAFDTTQITSPANFSNPQPGDPCHPLARGAHAPAIAFPTELSVTQCASAEEISPALSVKHTTSIAYAIQERAVSENPDTGPDGAGFRDDGAAYTLEARSVPQAVAFALRGREGGAMAEVEGDQVGALRAASGGSSRSYVAATAVRRLTPRECERLQGFPDDYTMIPWRKKPADQCPDGPRYKALGNSMAVPVMAWIGQRIAEVERITREGGDA